MAEKVLNPVLAKASDGDLEGIESMEDSLVVAAVKAVDEDKRTALHLACAAGHTEVARCLISRGADVNHADDEDWTPLHSCVSKGDSALVELLLEHKAGVDTATSSKATALHLGASKGHSAVVSLLLAAGASKQVREYSGATPLLRAAAANRVETLKILIEAKADVTARDRSGENALHIAINGHCMGACEVLMGCDEAEEMMKRENEDKKTPAQLIVDMPIIEVRDTLKSFWRATHGES